jgi:hypothetical protein
MKAFRLTSPARALALAAIAAVTFACVRADPPAAYTCYAASDCPSGSKCSVLFTCIPPNQCLHSGDCAVDQVCDTHQRKCVAAECWPGHLDVCSGYACVNGACNHSCSNDNDCQAPLVCRVPRADGGADAGTDGGTDAGRAKVCGPAPLYPGHACVPGDDCGELSCCSSDGKMVCGQCLAKYSVCTRKSDCMSGLCCEASHYVTSDAVVHYIYECVDIATIGLYDPTCVSY